MSVKNNADRYPCFFALPAFVATLATLFIMLPIPIMAAPTIANTDTIIGITLLVSGATSAGYSASCTDLTIDVTGAIYTSGRFAAYGYLNCPGISGAYAVFGSGYSTAGGGVFVALSVAGFDWYCTLNSTLNGSCPIYSGAAVRLGTATLVPR